MNQKNYSKSLATTLCLLVGLFFVNPALSNECSSLIPLLKDLQKAQRSVSDSLIQNHYIMGDTLESYSETMRDSRGKAYDAIAKNMGKAGQSFKARAEKATGHSSLIADNTSEIISLAEKCISVK